MALFLVFARSLLKRHFLGRSSLATLYKIEHPSIPSPSLLTLYLPTLKYYILVHIFIYYLPTVASMEVPMRTGTYFLLLTFFYI